MREKSITNEIFQSIRLLDSNINQRYTLYVYDDFNDSFEHKENLKTDISLKSKFMSRKNLETFNNAITIALPFVKEAYMKANETLNVFQKNQETCLLKGEILLPDASQIYKDYKISNYIDVNEEAQPFSFINEDSRDQTVLTVIPGVNENALYLNFSRQYSGLINNQTKNTAQNFLNFYNYFLQEM